MSKYDIAVRYKNTIYWYDDPLLATFEADDGRMFLAVHLWISHEDHKTYCRFEVIPITAEQHQKLLDNIDHDDIDDIAFAMLNEHSHHSNEWYTIDMGSDTHPLVMRPYYEQNGLDDDEWAALPPYDDIAGKSFSEIKAIYGEETAVNVGIARDRDARG